MKAFDIMKQFMNYEHDTLIEDLYEDKSLLVYLLRLQNNVQI